ncbi:serine protease [bacterium]|jgi:S1-C subfamily serine protease|nr:serine protease [bacterium]MBT4895014.1 serine protease [bacterium]
MEIEKLTKMQIVLLTLLVSFVTSIATGIVTVTLMDQAPPAMVQTLNRVVERTVERVVPDESKQGASVITKETTVVVKEEDLITDSINRNSKNVVRIYETLEGGTKRSFSGLGVIVSRGGIITTDLSVIEDGSMYIVETADGEAFDTQTIETEEPASLAFLSIDLSEKEGKTFPSATFSKSNSFKLGQTVLSLTGEERTDVAIGIIAGLIEKDIVVENTNTETDVTEEVQEIETIKVLSTIKTSIADIDVTVGSPLVDIFGEVVGISTEDSLIGKTALFTPITGIQSVISKIIKAQDKVQDTEEEVE